MMLFLDLWVLEPSFLAVGEVNIRGLQFFSTLLTPPDHQFITDNYTGKKV